MSIDDMTGTYEGQGTWRDSAGNTGGYAVVQRNLAAQDELRIRQDHVHDGAGQRMDFVLCPVAPHIYRVEAHGVGDGFGFVVDDVVRFYVHNHLGSVTELGYRLAGTELRVYGSCTRNSDGNYIMWHETLLRVPETAC